jgi:hypothetical protein
VAALGSVASTTARPAEPAEHAVDEGARGAAIDLDQMPAEGGQDGLSGARVVVGRLTRLVRIPLVEVLRVDLADVAGQVVDVVTGCAAVFGVVPEARQREQPADERDLGGVVEAPPLVARFPAQHVTARRRSGTRPARTRSSILLSKTAASAAILLSVVMVDLALRPPGTASSTYRLDRAARVHQSPGDLRRMGGASADAERPARESRCTRRRPSCPPFPWPIAGECSGDGCFSPA